MAIPVEQLIIKIAGDSKDLLKEYKKIKKENKTLGDSFETVGKVAGTAFLAASAAATAFGVASVKAFMEFETGLTGVIKTTNLAGKDLETFKKNIVSLSEEIPVGTEKLLEISSAAGQLGINGVENLTKFTKTIALLGATTDLEGEDAALTIAKILNLTGDGVETVDTFGSTIVELGNNFATSESAILEVAKEVAKATVNFGLSSTEILGMSTAMSSLGIEAEAGSTVVGQAFMKIDSAIRKDAGPAYNKLIELTGLTGEQLKKTFKEDASEVFQLFIEGLGESGEKGEDMTAILGELGLSGIRVNKILPTLANRSEILADSMNMAGKAAIENSALNKEAATAFATSASRMQIAQTKVNNTLIEIGEDIAPDVITALEDITEAARKSRPVWEALGTGIKWFSKGASAGLSILSDAIELGRGNVDSFRKETEKNAKADQKFLDEQVRKRGMTTATFRREQRKLRRKAAKKKIEDAKKEEEKLTEETTLGDKARTDKLKEAEKEREKVREEARQRRVEADLEADQEMFENIEADDQKILEKLQNRLDKETAKKETARKKEEAAEKKAAEKKKIADKEREGFQSDHFKRIDVLYAESHKGRLLSETTFGKGMVAIDQTMHSGKYKGTKSAAGELSALINSENSKMKEVGKAATMIQIGISTAESAMKAFAGLAWIPVVGPALGVTAAALITAYGAEQISNVQSMKEGGIVPGVGGVGIGDKVPTLLEPGELVVPRDITKDLLKDIGAANMANGGVAGEKQQTDLQKSFYDIFSVPGLFKMMMKGATPGLSASGFGSDMFDGMYSDLLDNLQGGADGIADLIAKNIPGGQIIAEVAKWTSGTVRGVTDMLKDTGIESEIRGILGDDIVDMALGGGPLEEIGTRAVVQLVDELAGGIGDAVTGLGAALGFQEGGLVGATEPGEMRLSRNALQAIANGVNTSNNNTTSVRHISKKSTTQASSQKVGVEIYMNGNAAEIINAQLREGKNLGTIIPV